MTGMTAQARPKGNRFSTLPKRIAVEDMVTTSDTDPVPDPEGGRDTNRDFLIRYGFGLL